MEIENSKHYHGMPCKVCGCEVRTKKGRRCVECKRLLDAGGWQRRKERTAILKRHDLTA